MSISATILPEFDHEMATTRTLLERVPEADADWKPHPKSYGLADLATHIANLPGWAVYTFKDNELDFNPPGGVPFKNARIDKTSELLSKFDESVKAGHAAIAAATDADFMMPWTLKNGGSVIFTLPRRAVVRTFIMNHIIHHRGQLSVYLRLRDIPLPSVYGPTADTQP